MPADGIARGPFLAIPDGAFAAVEFTAITESMGNLQRCLQQAGSQLLPGGELLLDVDHAQSPAAVRWALEGRPGAFEPAGAPHDPERAFRLRPLLEALDRAGILVTDCVPIPAPEAAPPEFVPALLDQGLLASGWIGSPPPSRWRIYGRKARLRAGSVLIGAGAADAQQRTASAVRAFLPTDWELWFGAGTDERESWHQGIADSEGELLWLLPAGALPSRALFTAQVARAALSPALPRNHDPRGGGVLGLMASRLDLLAAGPIPRRWQCQQVAYEDHGLRLEAAGRGPTPVDGDIVWPSRPSEAPQLMACEAEALTALWRPFASSSPKTLAGLQPASPTVASAAEPTITLCMIVRNEQRFLPACLASAAAAVDDIVVVDTGSTDRTVAIAESHGARVLHAAWQDDFAAARNVGLAACTGDWVLVLDADEQLEPGAAAQLRTLARDPSVCGYHLLLRNVFADGKTQGVRLVRFFRRLDGIRWANRIHEQISPALMAAAAPLGLTLSSCDVGIEHFGYRDDVMRDRHKDDRNERLFCLELADHPHDLYSLYKYGDFLRRLPGREADSLATLQRALEVLWALPVAEQRTVPYAGEVVALTALALFQREQGAAAATLVERGLRQLLPTPNLYYVAAGVALSQGCPDDALALYQRCLAYDGQVLIVPIQEGITGPVALTGMAQAWLVKGDHDRARRLLALAQPADFEITALTQSKLLFERGDPAAAVQVLTDHLSRHPEAIGACQQATLIMQHLGMTTQAQAMAEHAARLLNQQNRPAEARRIQATVAGVPLRQSRRGNDASNPTDLELCRR